jgi:hypothetical protein
LVLKHHFAERRVIKEILVIRVTLVIRGLREFKVLRVILGRKVCKADRVRPIL